MLRVYLICAGLLVSMGLLSAGGSVIYVHWNLHKARQEGYLSGIAEANAAADKKIAERDARLDKLRQTSQAELTAARHKRIQSEVYARAEIRKLLEENAALRRWADTSVPAEFAAYAWGLPDNKIGDHSSIQMLLGPRPFATDKTGGEASEESNKLRTDVGEQKTGKTDNVR